MSEAGFRLNEAINVPGAQARDRLVRRMRALREEAVIEKNTIQYWNRTHPDEQPIDTAFEDSVIAWCDGEGPLPTMAPDGTENLR